MSQSIQFESFIACSLQEIWDFHTSVEALVVLTPPPTQIKIIGQNLEVRDGALHELSIKKGPIPLVWNARISEVSPATLSAARAGFVDTAEKSPFHYWRHQHEFVVVEGGVLLLDWVQYALPMGKLGNLVAGKFVEKDIISMFEFRHFVTTEALSKA